MKSKHLFFLLSIYVISCMRIVWASTPPFSEEKCDTITHKADSLFKKGYVEKCIPLYRQAFLECNNMRVSSELSKAYALNGNMDSAFYFIHQSIALDTNPFYIFDFGEYYNLLTDSRWDALLDQQIRTYESLYRPIKNKSLTKKLCHMRVKDQAFYYHHAFTLGEPNLGVKYWMIKEELNKENLKELTELIDLYGWPKKSEVGGDGEVNGAAFLVIQHCNDLTTMKKYKPYLEECVQLGEAKKSNLALLTDRIHMMEGEKQIYGSQISYDMETKIYFLQNVIDPKNLNKRRAEMDMVPIEEYLKIWDAELRLDDE